VQAVEQLGLQPQAATSTPKQPKQPKQPKEKKEKPAQGEDWYWVLLQMVICNSDAKQPAKRTTAFGLSGGHAQQFSFFRC
jgi:hypothetical protein